MESAYAVSLVLIALVSAFAVLNPSYQDNLGQRIGMAVACLGSVAELYTLAAGFSRDNAATLLMAGIALFAVSTVWKKYRQSFGYNRRSTDRHLKV